MDKSAKSADAMARTTNTNVGDGNTAARDAESSRGVADSQRNTAEASDLAIGAIYVVKWVRVEEVILCAETER